MNKALFQNNNYGAALGGRIKREKTFFFANYEAVRAGTLSVTAVRRLGFPWSAALADRSRRSVGGTLAVVSWAYAEGAAGHLAGGTHHAFADRGEGFCVFNDLAVAARVAQRDHGARRVAISQSPAHSLHPSRSTSLVEQGGPPSISIGASVSNASGNETSGDRSNASGSGASETLAFQHQRQPVHHHVEKAAHRQPQQRQGPGRQQQVQRQARKQPRPARRPRPA